MQYKINQSITVRYLAIDNEEGLTDLKLTPTNPSGVDQTPITFAEIGDGLYTTNFTPNIIGWWLVRVSSLTKPKNVYSKSYFVGTEYTTYPPQEDGKLTSIDTKLGEVQASPTTNTLLARLKNIYDKLVIGIIATVDKVKVWDGTNEVQVTPTGRLKVSSEPPTAPPATTLVIRTVYGDVAGYVDDIYTIPNLATLYIQRFNSGGVPSTKGERIELWYDPLGTGIGMIIIDVIYVSGNSVQHDLNVNYTGNGTRAIRMRRENLTGGNLSIFGRWEGYYY